MVRRSSGTLLASAGLSLGLALLIGCFGGGKSDKDKGGPAEKKLPVFTLAWSEYPSWSVFGAASELGLIKGKEGELGVLEKKWGVDINLKFNEYDPCIGAYEDKACDAVCITNMDVLGSALKRNSVAVLPTSTSYGADACIVLKTINDLDALKGRKVFGQTKTVSEYVFYRCLQLQGKSGDGYKFENMSPEDAAKGMQDRRPDIEAVMVWNPFVLQTLKSRTDVKVLFSSTSIPEEIIDMVVVGEDVLKKEGGKEFVCCVIDCYYEFNKRLADEKDRDKLLITLGDMFSRLKLDDMKTACEQTRFYKTPEEALTLLEGEGKLSKKKFPETMKTVVDFSVAHKFIDKAPKIGYGSADTAGDSQLRFDPTYIKMVKDKK
jgi:ABC-type nitrate/sulfonate/bicarbonate transport system substrate-binding protein